MLKAAMTSLCAGELSGEGFRRMLSHPSQLNQSRCCLYLSEPSILELYAPNIRHIWFFEIVISRVVKT